MLLPTYQQRRGKGIVYVCVCVCFGTKLFNICSKAAATWLGKKPGGPLPLPSLIRRVTEKVGGLKAQIVQIPHCSTQTASEFNYLYSFPAMEGNVCDKGSSRKLGCMRAPLDMNVDTSVQRDCSFSSSAGGEKFKIHT